MCRHPARVTQCAVGPLVSGKLIAQTAISINSIIDHGTDNRVSRVVLYSDNSSAILTYTLLCFGCASLVIELLTSPDSSVYALERADCDSKKNSARQSVYASSLNSDSILQGPEAWAQSSLGLEASCRPGLST